MQFIETFLVFSGVTAQLKLISYQIKPSENLLHKHPTTIKHFISQVILLEFIKSICASHQFL